MLQYDRLFIVRLLLLNSKVSPLDALLENEEEEEEEKEESTFLQIAKDQNRESIVQEMQIFLANPIRYHSNHSALIALAIGLVSIDLPVLIVTSISEYLVSINEEKLFGQYSEQKSWDIAALIKKKAQIEN